MPDLSAPEDRLVALRAAVAAEAEPLVTLTHLLRLCRDEHPELWARVNDPPCRARVACVATEIKASLPTPGTATVLDAPARQALAAALEPREDPPPVLIARALAELLDTHYGHTFAGSFARRSPYQPRVGEPVPLDGVDLRRVTALPPTAPPWRLANRLDETRRVRLAGAWAAQFRVIFDYCLADTLAGVIDADTVIATCHPNTSLDELDRPRDRRQRSFPIRPADPDRQRDEIHRLVSTAVAAGASIVVLPELCVTESLASELRNWVRRPDGPRLLVAGSYHHEDDHHGDDGDGAGPAGAGRRRNTAVAWIRGSDRPISHDKHSPADLPIGEDIQPEGWPELRIHVTADGWHLVLAICRDLLNPLAVLALNEAGVNLVLAPAMSETLVPFGGPVAQLVAANQALVVVANNPAQWPDPARPTLQRTPARALFGHPGFGQQTRFVPSPDPGPGLARLHVHSGQLGWLPAPSPGAATPGGGPGGHPPASPSAVAHRRGRRVRNGAARDRGPRNRGPCDRARHASTPWPGRTRSGARSGGPYARVRHPQYDGFLLVMIGFLLQWPTIPTLIMFPVLLVVYAKLARSEEGEVDAQFGQEWTDYAAHTPAFVPRLARRSTVSGRSASAGPLS